MKWWSSNVNFFLKEKKILTWLKSCLSENISNDHQDFKTVHSGPRRKHGIMACYCSLLIVSPHHHHFATLQESYTIQSYEHILDSVATGRINYNSQYTVFKMWFQYVKKILQHITFYFQIAFKLLINCLHFINKVPKLLENKEKTRLNKIRYVH